MNIAHRSNKLELLDADNIPFEDIRQNMQELNFINTYLGGHAITIHGFKKLIGSKKQITICEIGCGGGDNLAAIKQWCNKKNITVHCIGIDIKSTCVQHAQQHPTLQKNMQWIVSGYELVQFEKKPDVIFSSLFCHHFSNHQLVQQLQWMQANSTIGFFINDLHRHQLAYYSIKLLTKLFSKSYLVKNDAPLSVLRGFTKTEWKQLFNMAAIHANIEWKWAFRYLITYQHAAN
jgi:2-polyprenyl-3-methyl-5-hydroxy-6-metoxy-1,4-benzoquinol methylase